MRTSDPDIYAVGDVTEVRHFITGKPASVALAGPANRQEGSLPTTSPYQEPIRGIQGTGILKIFDMTVAFTGLSEREAKSRASFTTRLSPTTIRTRATTPEAGKWR